ncbi:Phospho-N-acetylmuramoyl-pentapeptide-transferase [Trichinella pseudospiralis]
MYSILLVENCCVLVLVLFVLAGLFICETGTTIFIQLLIDSLPSGCRWTLTSVGPLKRSSRLAGWLAGWLGHGC